MKLNQINDIRLDINLKITDYRLDCCVKEDLPPEQDIVCLFYLNENNVKTLPQIQVLIGNQPCKALIDAGCQCSIISEELYN
jgi:hypothetical protein